MIKQSKLLPVVRLRHTESDTLAVTAAIADTVAITVTTA